jgi:hypothetical protein
MSVISRTSLNAFDPRVADGKLPGERLSALRSCANLFNFGGRTLYSLQAHDGKIVAIEEKASLSKIQTVFKVLAIATIILPLLAAIGALVYHHLNKIEIRYTKEQQKAFCKEIEKAFQDKNLIKMKQLVNYPIFNSLDVRIFSNFLFRNCMEQDNIEMVRCFINTSNFERITQNEGDLSSFSHNIIDVIEDIGNSIRQEQPVFIEEQELAPDVVLESVRMKISFIVELLKTSKGREFLSKKDNRDRVILEARRCKTIMDVMTANKFITEENLSQYEREVQESFRNLKLVWRATKFF